MVLGELLNGPYGDFRSIFDDIQHSNDEFFILKDFNAYAEAHEEIYRRYQKRFEWLHASAVNIANSGLFLSDRTIDEFANQIWQVKPVIIS